MLVIPLSYKNILKGCLVLECLKRIYAAFDLIPESESRVRRNILQDHSENITGMLGASLCTRSSATLNVDKF